jgi:thiamine-monophosphate kinase
MASGEFDLIASLVGRLPPAGPRVRVASGDDAAVTEPAGAAATTIDSIVEGVHFELPAFPLAAVGRKALASALSDLAAMGAEPGEAYVWLGAPPSLSEADLLEVGEGLAEVAERHSVSVAGGDLTAAPVLALSVACVGYEPAGGRLLTRAGAGAGDALAVNGELGGAAGGLIALGLAAAPAGAPEAELSSAERAALVARQLDPRPRLAEGLALAAAGATALIDVSDGLGADAGHIASASGIAIELELEAVPVSAELTTFIGEHAARELAAGGGEDYELLAAVPADRFAQAAEAVKRAGGRLTQVGRALKGEGVSLLDRAGSRRPPAGFDHMRGSRSGAGSGSDSGAGSDSTGGSAGGASDPASSPGSGPLSG